MCNVITMAKVLVAKLRKDVKSGDRLSGKRLAEHELLQSAVQQMDTCDEPIVPKLNVKAVKNPEVDEDLLPPNAKRLRKRPAQQ